MPLVDKLKRIKHFEEDVTENAWEIYKNEWVKAINELEHTIMDNWFKEYAKEKLMEFNLIPSKRIEGYLGEYSTASLEISLSNNTTFLLAPVSGVTNEYDGKLEFFMLNYYKVKVAIFRHILEDKSNEWILATSYKKEDHRKLTKNELENLIEQWIS